MCFASAANSLFRPAPFYPATPRAPGTGEKIKLRGLESYSAAMHCAAVAAGERLAKSTAASASAAASASGAPGTSPGPALHPTSSAPLQGLSSGSDGLMGQGPRGQSQQRTPLQHCATAPSGAAGELPVVAAAAEGLVLPPASSAPSASSFSRPGSGSGLPMLGSTSSSSAIATAALVTGGAGAATLGLGLDAGELCGGGGGVPSEAAEAGGSGGGSSGSGGGSAMTPGRRRTFLGTLLKSLQGAKRVC